MSHQNYLYEVSFDVLKTGFQTSVIILWEKQCKDTGIGTQYNKTSIPQKCICATTTDRTNAVLLSGVDNSDHS